MSVHKKKPKNVLLCQNSPGEGATNVYRRQIL